MQKQCAYGVAFSCLPRPAGCDELVCLELLDEFGLVSGWVEAYGLIAELNRICWNLNGLVVEELFFKVFEFAFLLLFHLSTPPACLGLCPFGVRRIGRRLC